MVKNATCRLFYGNDWQSTDKSLFVDPLVPIYGE